MANLDTQTAAQLKAQIESHPQFRALQDRYGRGRGSRAIPGDVLRSLGIDVPAGYEYNFQTRTVLKPFGAADVVLPILGGAVLGTGVGLAATGGPAAGSAGTTAAVEAGPTYGYGYGAAAPEALGGAAPAGAGLGSVVPPAASAGGGFLSGLKDLITDPQALAGLTAVIGGLATQGRQSPGADEIARINAITEAQMRRADPLHRVAVNLAYGRMPTQYRQGVPLPDVPLPR